MDTHPNAVVVDRLSKTFGSRTVVDQISFNVPRGSVTGLIGPNGAGKTTIMGMLLGLVRPTSGAASVLGSSIDDRAAYLPKVGSLIEGPAFHPGVSGIDNLRALAILAGLDSPTLAAEIDGLIETVGLTGRGDDRYGDYSLGMKQRLGIAAALLGSPELVILDEPTNGLDPVGMQQIRELIAQIGAGGSTVIVSSHLLAELEQVCDWLVVIESGGLVHSGPVSELGATDEALVLGVPTAQRDALEMLVERLGHEVLAPTHDGEVVVRMPADCDPHAIAASINASAHDERIVLHELRRERADLEARYLQMVTPHALTGGSQ